MYHKILHILFLLLAHTLYSQENDVWIRFIDSKTELSGYKNLKGNIKIPAEFDNLTKADTFYNIIAVTEDIGSSYKRYYLLKDGRKVGQDSVFMFDFTYDCESEGKILFKDYKTDRVGFFDKNGTVAIPAIYNEAGSFHNGVAVALKNANKKCWGILSRDTDDTLNCEHIIWRNGERVLINAKNEILIKNWTIEYALVNWYSMKVNDRSIDTSIFFNIKGENGNLYSFINYEKEFNKWFYVDFLSGLRSNDKKKFGELCYPHIAIWSETTKAWNVKSKEKFLKAFSIGIPGVTLQQEELTEISINRQFINDIDWDFDDANTNLSNGTRLYQAFYTSCGKFFEEKYPVFKVSTTYYKKRKIQALSALKQTDTKIGNPASNKTHEIYYRNNFYFIMTAIGYKLINVAVKM